MVKIAIVGADASKWLTIENAKEKVMKETGKILNKYLNASRPWEGCDMEDIIFISGGCPKSGTDEWSETQARQMLPSQEQIKIFKPEVNQWNDMMRMCRCGRPECEQKPYKVMGYKSRNIKIAETCDVLYCIVPYVKDAYCYHHKGEQDQTPHPKNGGCWTRNYAHSIGKEVHLVVIE